MNRRVNSVSVENAAIELRVGSLSADTDHSTSRKSSRLWRALTLILLIGKFIKAFGDKSDTAAAPSQLDQEKGSLMSATAPAPNSNGTKDSKREMLETLVKQDKTVEVSKDDTFERAQQMDADEFKQEFEKKVSGLSGFSAPFKGAKR